MWLGEKCQSIAQSYRSRKRIESWGSFPHLPSQNSICTKTTESFSLLVFKGVKTFHAVIKLFKSFCVFRIETWKYCSKLSMQTENWILKQLCSFAKPNSNDVPSTFKQFSSTLSVKNPSVKSDEFLPWWRIFFTDEIFYRRIFFTDELVFLFGQYFAFCCLKTP